MALLLLFFSFATPNFLSTNTFLLLAKHIALYGILAIGMTLCYYYLWYRSFCRSRRWIGRYDCRGPDTKWTNGAGTWCNTVFQHTTCYTFHIAYWSIRRLDQWNYYYKVWSSTIHCNTWDDVYCPFPILY